MAERRLSDAEMANALGIAEDPFFDTATEGTLASALLDCHDDLRALATYVRSLTTPPMRYVPPDDIRAILARVGAS